MQNQESTSETYLRCEMRRTPYLLRFKFYAFARFNLAVKIWTMKHRCKTLSLVILNPCSDMHGMWQSCWDWEYAPRIHHHYAFQVHCATCIRFCDQTMWCSRFLHQKKLGKGAKKDGNAWEKATLESFSLLRAGFRRWGDVRHRLPHAIGME